MHDESSLTTERANRVLTERILPAVHANPVPLKVQWAVLPGEPIAPAEAFDLDYEPYSVGTPWGPSWGTTWFRVQGTVPDDWSGQRVEAVIDLGFDVSFTGFQCEGLVYRADGTPIKSLNPRNQWVLVSENARAGESVDWYIEAASNPVILDSHPFLPTEEGDVLTSSTNPRYTTRRMDLTLFVSELFELALDVDVLLQLQEQLPDGPRKMQILQALDDALDVLDLQALEETAQVARGRLERVLAAPATASAHRISAIGHAHIDSAWLWPARETIRKVARTASSMTDLIDATDSFVYGMSSAQQYAWIKEHRPEVWDRVKAAVSAGRFIPLGGMWVESDTVMPHGEALVRQFLYGQDFFQREFGKRCKGVWLPDSFGYSPALPQLLNRAGFEWFFTQKISWNQVNKFPHHTFAWEGIDGSRTFTHFPPMDTYNSELTGEEVAKASRQFQENRSARGSIAPVGYGDGGGGTTREMVGRAERLADLEGSAQVTWEHPDDFYDRARSELPNPPVWVGELYLELHRATLTSQHKTKQGNRRGEHLLIEAELWSATAAVQAGYDYPYDELDALWKTLLLHQFHDILPGTSIAWVHREAVAEYARLSASAEDLIVRAQQVLAGPGDTSIAFNPAPVPQNGIEPFAAREHDVEDVHAVRIEQVGAMTVLDNGVVRVSIDDHGLITSALDVATGREAIADGQPANLLQLHQDFPNRWDAWDVDRFYRNSVTNLMDVEQITTEVDDAGTAHVVVSRRFSNSTVVQDISLAPDSRTVLFDQRTDWHETEKFLKVAFPLDVRAEHTTAETQFGVVKRATHVNTSWEAAKFETSMHRFVLVEEPGFGVALVNDSIYGFDTTRELEDQGIVTTVRLSLLRAPRFPDPQTDQGMQTHRYGLVVGAGVEDATAEGLRLNFPITRVDGSHGVEPLVECGPEAIVSCVKLAADQSGDLVVRLYEPTGARVRTSLTVKGPFTRARAVTLLEDPIEDAETVEADGGMVKLSLSGFEVRTLRFS